MLNLTVEQTEETQQQYSEGSRTQTNNEEDILNTTQKLLSHMNKNLAKRHNKNDKNKILHDLTSNFVFTDQYQEHKQRQKYKQCIQSLLEYKTQSKAFQQLVSVLKINTNPFLKYNLQSFYSTSLGSTDVKNIKKKISSKEMFKDHILFNKKKQKNLNIQQKNNKIFIKFYSKYNNNSDKLNDINPNNLQSKKSQKLILNKKNPQNINTKPKTDNNNNNKMTNINYNVIPNHSNHQQAITNNQTSKRQQSKTKNQSTTISKEKGNKNIDKNYLSGKKINYNYESNKNKNSPQILTPIKVQSKIQQNTKEIISKRLSSKMINQNYNSKEQKEHKEISNNKTKQFNDTNRLNQKLRSKSQVRLRKQPRSLSNNTKNQKINNEHNKLSHQLSPKALTGRKLSVQKFQQNNQILMVKDLSNKRLKSRKKSLDLNKLKTQFQCNQSNNQQNNQYLSSQKSKQNQENNLKLIQRYPKFQENQLIMIRTANVSPQNRNREYSSKNNNQNQINLEKSDNIFSIKKKKLQMLKKKIQLQKSQKK